MYSFPKGAYSLFCVNRQWWEWQAVCLCDCGRLEGRLIPILLSFPELTVAQSLTLQTGCPPASWLVIVDPMPAAAVCQPTNDSFWHTVWMTPFCELWGNVWQCWHESNTTLYNLQRLLNIILGTSYGGCQNSLENWKVKFECASDLPASDCFSIHLQCKFRAIISSTRNLLACIW